MLNPIPVEYSLSLQHSQSLHLSVYFGVYFRKETKLNNLKGLFVPHFPWDEVTSGSWICCYLQPAFLYSNKPRHEIGKLEQCWKCKFHAVYLLHTSKNGKLWLKYSQWKRSDTNMFASSTSAISVCGLTLLVYETLSCSIKKIRWIYFEKINSIFY